MVTSGGHVFSGGRVCGNPVQQRKYVVIAFWPTASGNEPWDWNWRTLRGIINCDLPRCSAASTSAPKLPNADGGVFPPLIDSAELQRFYGRPYAGSLQASPEINAVARFLLAGHGFYYRARRRTVRARVQTTVAAVDRVATAGAKPCTGCCSASDRTRLTNMPQTASLVRALEVTFERRIFFRRNTRIRLSLPTRGEALAVRSTPLTADGSPESDDQFAEAVDEGKGLIAQGVPATRVRGTRLRQVMEMLHGVRVSGDARTDRAGEPSLRATPVICSARANLCVRRPSERSTRSMVARCVAARGLDREEMPLGPRFRTRTSSAPQNFRNASSFAPRDGSGSISIRTPFAMYQLRPVSRHRRVTALQTVFKNAISTSRLAVGRVLSVFAALLMPVLPYTISGLDARLADG